MTPFRLMLQLTGLSLREAAQFLQISMSSAEKMSNGKLAARDTIIQELRGLYSRQFEASEEAVELIEKSMPDEVEIGYPADDHEAQSLGWPCIGAWAGMAAQVIGQIHRPVRLVPRGSTLATAAAVDAHERGGG
jgi:hypothetical protein